MTVYEEELAREPLYNLLTSPSESLRRAGRKRLRRMAVLHPVSAWRAWRHAKTGPTKVTYYLGNEWPVTRFEGEA